MGFKDSQLGKMIRWCFTPDHTDLKHNTWSHPIFSLIVITSSSIAIAEHLSQLYSKGRNTANIPEHLRLSSGIFLSIYYLIMFSTRLAVQKSKVFYDMMWACNVSMLISIYSLFKNDSLLLGASIVIIAIDQILWYVDCIGYLIFRKFKVGVAKYLIWPEIHIIQKITATHHIWFIPFCGYILKQCGGLNFDAYLISVVITAVLWAASRILVPKILKDEGNKEHPEHYMNINLSWELWKDVKIGWMKALTADAPFFRSMFFTLLIWNTLNFGCYLLLKWIFKVENFIIDEL